MNRYRCDLCKSNYWSEECKKFKIISSDCYLVTVGHTMQLCCKCLKLLTSGNQYHVKLEEIEELK